MTEIYENYREQMNMNSLKHIQTKKSYLLMLIRMSEADNTVQPDEEAFILAVTRSLGLTVDDLENVKKHPDSFPFTLPATMEERIKEFYNLLILMGIDGVISPEEKELCRQLGFRLLLNPPLINDLIDLIVDNINRKIPEDQMLRAVFKYMN